MMMMIAKIVLRLVPVLCVLLAATGEAKADMIRIFDATGTFNDGATLSGTVTIDITTGLATTMDMTVSAATTWPGPGTPPPLPPSFTYEGIHDNVGGNPYIIESTQAVNGLSGLYLAIPNTDQPIGYTGGPLAVNADANDTTFSGTFYSYSTTGPEQTSFALPLTSGELVPVGAPEPTTITLLASGFFAFGGFSLYRRRSGKAS